MAYNPYGGGHGHHYGAPPGYGGGYPGSAPGMAAPPGLGPPPGMSSAPGMAPPPGVQHANAPQANRPSGLPPSFQAPTNMPNINFNAPVIRLGTGAPASGGRSDDRPAPSGRPGLGMERGQEQGGGRMAARDGGGMHALVPPSHEDKLRTMFLQQIPEGIGGDEGVQRLLGAVGKLRRWDPSVSVLEEHKGTKFGFALFEDPDSLATAVQLLRDEGVDVPVKRQLGTSDPPPTDDTASFDGIEKTRLQVAIDQSSVSYLESYKEGKREDQNEGAEARLEAARTALQRVIRELFYPPAGANTEANGGDTAMGNTETGENVEVVNIPLAQEDELADIPAEMREVVAGEIAAFRERSNRRDMERLKREEELEEVERRRNGTTRSSRLDSPPPANSNNVPLGPRGSNAVPNAPSGPKGQNGGNRVAFVNGGVSNATELPIHQRADTHHRDYNNDDEDDTDADDEELYKRTKAEKQSEEDKLYSEAERKWVNRERSRQAALDRERDREKHEVESLERRKQEQLERERTWDDDKESSRKSHIYHRDRAAWARKRTSDRAEEEARDEADRLAEQAERRREQAQLERARGLADSFLDQQAQEMEQREISSATAAGTASAVSTATAAAAAAPQPFKLSLGEAAQRAQARAGPQRRTIAEVEGLLDDEEAESTKRQLVPIQMDAATAGAGMSEEEISQAVRALAQEIPSEREGLWRWDVKWEFMDDAAVKDKLRPFVERKIVEYLGVREEMLVEAVEDHLRKHGEPGALVEELEGALDDEAEDLVKKLWRMVIFLTECEKRGLPA